MPDLHFTKAAIDALEVPAGKRQRFSDVGKNAVRYLVLNVNGSTGRKVFYHYRRIGQQIVDTRLGQYPEMTIDQARKAAETLNAQVSEGVNPAQLRAEAKAEMTLSELFDWHGRNFAKRERTRKQDRRRLELYFPDLLPLRLSEITRQQLRRAHKDGGKFRPAPSQKKLKAGEAPLPPRAAVGTEANRAVALVRVLFKRAIAEEVFGGPNPAEGIEPHAERSRERRLMPDEVERFFLAVDQEENETIRDYVLLSLCTAARQGNVLAMAWPTSTSTGGSGASR